MMMDGDYAPGSAGNSLGSYGKGKTKGLPAPRKAVKGGFRKAGKATLKGSRRSSRRK